MAVELVVDLAVELTVVEVLVVFRLEWPRCVTECGG